MDTYDHPSNLIVQYSVKTVLRVTLASLDAVGQHQVAAPGVRF